MSEQHGFRTALSGFSRQDVLQYIDEMRRTFHEEREESEAQMMRLRQELSEAQQALADGAQAVASAEEKAAALAAAEEQVQSLTAELAHARAAVDAAREQALSEELAAVRHEVQSAREREVSLTAQLSEMHQAVASLWQEKEALEQRVAAALTLADEMQARAAAFKQQCGGGVVEEPENPGKPMEQWLF